MRKEELALKAMIAQNSALGQVVKHVSAGMHGGEASQEDHLSALTMAANDCLAASREYTKHVDPERFNACIPIHATKTAQKTFDVPELLEMILEKGDLGDILGMQCVNRQMRDAVANSIVLQRK